MPDPKSASRDDSHDLFVPTILDRLIAPEAFDGGPSLGFRLNNVIESVRRDLEDLLNTRQSHQGLSKAFVQLNDSIVAYGLPDFSAVDSTKEKARGQVGELVEAIVHRFEPRLRDVHAVPYEVAGDDRNKPTVRVHIEARLYIEPYPDVAFESVIELLSGQTSVKPSGG